jgi:hypothetical protein
VNTSVRLVLTDELGSKKSNKGEVRKEISLHSQNSNPATIINIVQKLFVKTFSSLLLRT